MAIIAALRVATGAAIDRGRLQRLEFRVSPARMFKPGAVPGRPAGEGKRMSMMEVFAMAALALGVPAAPAQAEPGQAARPPGFDRPIEAGSWGGIVRNGPGLNYARVASLREGERVTLLYNTGIVWNDYPWFLIRLGDGRLGFQWGGILCQRATPVAGIYQRCR